MWEKSEQLIENIIIMHCLLSTQWSLQTPLSAEQFASLVQEGSGASHPETAPTGWVMWLAGARREVQD